MIEEINGKTGKMKKAKEKAVVNEKIRGMKTARVSTSALHWLTT